MAKSGRCLERELEECFTSPGRAKGGRNYFRLTFHMDAASCPSSISLIFKVIKDKNIDRMGSIGVGCTIDRQVNVRIKEYIKSSIFFNGTEINLPTVESVIDVLSSKPLSVEITSTLPLGYGFGISGASSLATAIGINRLFSLKKSRLDLAKIAHRAEIINRTGLGSIATQITGGFLVKKEAGLPVKTSFLPFVGKKIYAVIIDKLETPKIIRKSNRLRRINTAAEKALRIISQHPNISLADILDISYNFAKESNLLTNQELIKVINEIKNQSGHATMLMLGQVAISDIKPKLDPKYHIEKLTISKQVGNLQ